MKRAREDSPEGEEPPTKQIHVEQLTFGPFTGTNGSWKDFWLETLQYMNTSDLWKLSCVCKNTFSLVWSLLLPNLESGLCFAGTEPEEIIKYLSKVPSLKRLDFSSPYKYYYEVLTTLTALSSLSHLAIPNHRKDEREADFPFESIKHLKGLIGLEGIPLHREDMLPVLQHFQDLKFLKVDGFCPDSDLLLHIEDMKKLEEIRLFVTHERECRYYDFDRQIPLDIPDLKEIGRKLRSLKIPLGRAAKGLNHISGLTNLTFLEADIQQRTIPQLPLLTNLKKLKVPGWNFHLYDKVLDLPATYEHFRHISDLTLFHGNGLHPEQAQCFEVGEFPSLTKLSCSGGTMPTELIARLTKLTNLNYLNVSMNFGKLDLSPISHLTNLRTIKSLPSALITNQEDLKLIPTSLTSLNFGWYQVTEANIASCCRLTGLTQLCFSENDQMTKNSIKLIAENFPQLKVLWLAKPTILKKGAAEEERTEILQPLMGLTGLQTLLGTSRKVAAPFWTAWCASKGKEFDPLFTY